MDHPLRLADQLRAHLRALRQQRGLTQAQLGQRLGLGQVRVAEIEARPGLVSTDQLIRVLAALGATLVLRDGDAVAEAAAPARRSAKKTTGKPASTKQATAKRAATKSAGAPPYKGSW